MKKIIVISGVPGTGKTVVARIVAKKMNANLIEINKLIGKEIKFTRDRKRKTRVVDMIDVQDSVSHHLDSKKLNIIEGHYAHLLNADKVIVLRTSPAVLLKRLKLRKWPRKKIHENLECELIDEITQEARAKHNSSRIYEIDTTKKSPYVVVDTVIDVINGKNGKKTHINWTKTYGYVFKNLSKYR